MKLEVIAIPVSDVDFASRSATCSSSVPRAPADPVLPSSRPRRQRLVAAGDQARLTRGSLGAERHPARVVRPGTACGGRARTARAATPRGATSHHPWAPSASAPTARGSRHRADRPAAANSYSSSRRRVDPRVAGVDPKVRWRFLSPITAGDRHSGEDSILDIGQGRGTARWGKRRRSHCGRFGAAPQGRPPSFGRPPSSDPVPASPGPARPCEPPS
jgi:hypothetical protein